MQKILFLGGGTAGHITPNIALFPFFKNFEVHYAGGPDSMEEELLKKYDFVRFHPLKCPKLIRSLSLKNLKIPFQLCKAKRAAKAIMAEIKPDVVFSKGGFAALPFMLCCGKDYPLVLHESDFSLGLANKLGAKHAKHILCSFQSAAEGYKNGIVTGSPLRPQIYLGEASKVKNLVRFSDFGINNSGRKNLLIFGGSLGSKAINKAVFDSIDTLVKRYNVIHIVGKNNLTALKKENYYQTEFVSDIENYFAWADLCVSRGGANSCFELVALKKPTLIIPLSKNASRGDQILNAEYFETRGFLNVLLEENLNDKTLISAIDNLSLNAHKLKQNMANAENIDGTKKIAKIILSAIDAK